MLIYSLCLVKFLDLFALSIIILLKRQNLTLGLLKGYSRTQKGYKCFRPAVGRYILPADVIFFKSKPKISTSLSSASEDDYDYLFNRKTLLNSGESTSKDVTDKDKFQFQDLIQVYTRRTDRAPVPPPTSDSNPTQASSEIVTTQLPGNSTTLPIALQKGKGICTQRPLFNFVSYSQNFIFLSFIYF